VVAVFVYLLLDGSLTDITFNVNRAVTIIDEINEAFKYAPT
jgi:hypothetical protein